MSEAVIQRLDLLYSEEQIHKRIAEMAKEIDACYKCEPLVVICVLKGAFMFFGDLVRRLSCKPELDFVRICSYGKESCSGEIVFSKDVELSLKDKHVLVIEDIVDSGQSMHYFFERLKDQGAKSLRLAALLDKTERRKVDVHVDFTGFALPEGFIVGYGLDYAERYRELPGLYIANVDAS